MRCLRESKCAQLKSFERHLAIVASRCEFAYGAMGRTGFLYDSVKDRLKWAKLRPKHYIYTLMRVGDWMGLDEETYRKEIVRQAKMSDEEIAHKLKAAFGG